ncbi:hypothetical protein K8I61_02960 [bacterium]|nr:hypothetical protein [bacterium]
MTPRANPGGAPPRFEQPPLTAVLLAIAAASAFAIGAWAWWVSHDRVNGYVRPHDPLWDFVCDVQAERGIPWPKGVIYEHRNPLIGAAKIVTARFGYSLAAITVVQVPFIVLLVAASAAIAWRLSGRFAALLSAWFAALAPMTVGLSTNLDELLALQACAALAVALWLSSWRRAGRFPIGYLAAFPLAFGVRSATYFSNGQTFLLIAGCAGAGTIAWAWIENRRPSTTPVPWDVVAPVAVSIGAGIAAAWPFSVAYLLGENARAEFEYLSVGQNPRVLLACAGVWFAYFAGPALGVVTFASLAVVAVRRRANAVAAPLLWLVLSFALFTLVTKRHDFYLVAAAPATYPLAAIGLSMIDAPRRRAMAALVAVLLVAAGFVHAIRSDIPEEPAFDLETVFEGVPLPYLFSPNARSLLHDDAVGEKVARACARENRPVFAVVKFGAAAVGVELFRRAPNLPLADIRRDRMFAGDHCLLLGDAHRRSIAPYLDNFARRHLGDLRETERTAALRSIERIRARAAEYRFVFAERGWALYILDSTDERAP